MPALSEWQAVDTEGLNTPRVESIRGVKVTVYFSLDDMPTGVRGDFEKGAGVFTISFRYNNDRESKLGKVLNENTTLRIGSRSKRLYAIELNIKRLDVKAVNLVTRKVEDALREVPARAEQLGMTRLDNYEAVSGAFTQVGPQIMTALESLVP